MLHRHEQFALDLLNTHGAEKAMDIAQQNLKAAKRNVHDLTYMDEVDWVYSHKVNALVFPKDINKNSKTAKNKEKRIKGNFNFYTAVINELKRLGKSGRS